MAAVLGGTVDEDDLAAAGLEVATINVPGQVVVGGPVGCHVDQPNPSLAGSLAGDVPDLDLAVVPALVL